MTVYDFNEEDIPAIIWEISNKITDLEDKVDSMSSDIGMLEKRIEEMED